MKPRVWLHIGAGKTGSSATQAALASVEEALRQERILYPNLAGESFENAKLLKINSGNIKVSTKTDLPWPNKIVQVI